MWQDREYSNPSDGTWVSRSRATWWVIGLTVLAHVGKLVAERIHPGARHWIDENLSTSYDGLRSFQLWRPFTYLLVHGDHMHLLWNMVTLGFCGTLLEPYFGSRRFLRVYLVSGVVASLSPFLRDWFMDDHAPTIGASGAINGVLVTLAFLMPNVVILFFMLVPMKIKWVVMILVGIDLMQILGGGGATDSLCHLLGASTGAWLAFVWPRLVEPRWLDYRRERARRREVSAIEENINEERELDRLLEKISREGMPGLSDAERRFLRRVSGKYQSTRRD